MDISKIYNTTMLILFSSSLPDYISSDCPSSTRSSPSLRHRKFPWTKVLGSLDPGLPILVEQHISSNFHAFLEFCSSHLSWLQLYLVHPWANTPRKWWPTSFQARHIFRPSNSVWILSLSSRVNSSKDLNFPLTSFKLLPSMSTALTGRLNPWNPLRFSCEVNEFLTTFILTYFDCCG